MAEPGPGRLWRPVVYGRTLRADSWWRVRSEGADGRWLEGTVLDAVASGAGLADGPRFVLAQGGRARLVGVACRTREISGSMHEAGGRELYCFVGWVRDGRTGGPAFADLRESWRAWAGEVYERAMAPVWAATPFEAQRTDPGSPVPAPWPERPAPAAGAAPPAPPVAVPPEDWAELWDRARAAREDGAVVLGWSTARAAHRTAGSVRLGVRDPDAPRLVAAQPTGRPPFPVAAATVALLVLVLVLGGALALSGRGGTRRPAPPPPASASPPPSPAPPSSTALALALAKGAQVVVGTGRKGSFLDYDGAKVASGEDTVGTALPEGTPATRQACAAALATAAGALAPRPAAPGPALCVALGGQTAGITIERADPGRTLHVKIVFWPGWTRSGE
ncbi:hypothetical protein [Actinomadura parmotrematis]|uniref:Uncharacterized protein n=1 Tax=Actinomadura parmotrematis TaxID=2864039 RepID=A0ABS7FP98_9ACTN|nr:hypothetical protein [Actinomadura parmotrematis]MBW8482207.1 hypothetical protein [Actinomadura parmotrematis]